MSFRIISKLPGALARTGKLVTPHGVIETPNFAVVGTKATVKSLTHEQVKATGAQVVLGNTYHLYLQPGAEIIRSAGGLGKFMGWNGPTMTDSGGFQVFSLGAAFGSGVSKVVAADSNEPNNLEITPLVKIDNEGVSFRSHLDGSEHRFTPERSMQIQHDLGADIIFAFDECTSPYASETYQREALIRTHAWAVRSLAEHQKTNTLGSGTSECQQLWGIVQGGRSEELRRESARVIGVMDFDGFGIGGSFDKKDMGEAVRWVNEILPEEKPRHLLGIGEPLDILDAVLNGCDLFDCVLPTRWGRNGTLLSRAGRVNIENAEYQRDFAPIEADCDCTACKAFSRAYLHHLFRAKEMLAATLATIHNLRFMMRFMADIRTAINVGNYSEFKSDFEKKYLGK